MSARAIGILSSVAFVALIGALLFGCAGRWDPPMFWAYLGVWTASALVGPLVVDPTLIKERLQPGPGGKDYAITIAFLPLWLGQYVVAGLDVGRFHWSATVPLVVQVVALLAMAAALAVTVWATVVNRFFSSVIRIQADRGHHLVTSGPYGYVRHPAYAVSPFLLIGGGLALGSWLRCSACSWSCRSCGAPPRRTASCASNWKGTPPTPRRCATASSRACGDRGWVVSTLRMILLAGGALGLLALVYSFGAESIASALTRVTWWQFALICLVHSLNVVVDSYGWRYAIAHDRAPFHRLVAARCASDAVNAITVVAAVGGEATKAWLLQRDIEALWSAVRFATFFVPASLGTLEGAVGAAFGAFGFSPGAGLAFTLVRRASQAVWIGVGAVVLMAMRPAPAVAAEQPAPVASAVD